MNNTENRIKRRHNGPLNFIERIYIQLLIFKRISYKKIGNFLGRSSSMIYYEVTMKGGIEEYLAIQAQMKKDFEKNEKIFNYNNIFNENLKEILDNINNYFNFEKRFSIEPICIQEEKEAEIKEEKEAEIKEEKEAEIKEEKEELIIQLNYQNLVDQIQMLDEQITILHDQIKILTNRTDNETEN